MASGSIIQRIPIAEPKAGWESGVCKRNLHVGILVFLWISILLYHHIKPFLL